MIVRVPEFENHSSLINGRVCLLFWSWIFESEISQVFDCYFALSRIVRVQVNPPHYPCRVVVCKPALDAHHLGSSRQQQQ